MPTAQIHNAQALYGESAAVSGQVIEYYINNSGGTLTTGDVVVLDVTGTKINSTTTANDTTTLGVVAGDSTLATANAVSFASLAMTPVVVKGPARINVASNAVAASGTLLGSTTAAKVATGAVASAAGLIGGFIGVSLEAAAAKDANNTIRAYIQKM